MKNQEFISTKQELKEAEKISWKDLFSGDILTSTFLVKQFSFIIFCIFLMMLYISNQYQYKKVYREFGSLKKQVSVLQFQSMELRAELMKYSRQSQVLKRVEDRKLGLELSSEPPIILEGGLK